MERSCAVARGKDINGTRPAGGACGYFAAPCSYCTSDLFIVLIFTVTSDQN
jgi:hypothetical protein